MKKKVGLVLGGGGAKGAYQIGVYLALKEFKQIKSIKAVSGTSIGALNSVLLANQKIEQAETIWRNLSRKNVLTLKNWKEYFKLKNFSVLSRRGMLDIFTDEIDFTKVSNSKIPIFIGVTSVENDCGEIFQLNGLDEGKIIDVLSASSAIPKIFAKVKIDNQYYYDGYKYLNVPIDCLVEQGCNFLFVIPLSNRLAPDAETNPNITIIDFNDKTFDQLGIWDGTLGFDANTISERIDLGYNNACKLLKYLREQDVIQITFFDKVKHFLKKLFRIKRDNKKYYCLEDVSASKEKDINVG